MNQEEFLALLGWGCGLLYLYHFVIYNLFYNLSEYLGYSLTLPPFFILTTLATIVLGGAVHETYKS